MALPIVSRGDRGMRKKIVAGLLFGALTVVPAIGQEEDAEPERVIVQHILIGFKGKVPGRFIDRSKAEAEALAREIVKRAEAGEDFGALVVAYTNGRAPGVYKMVNEKIEALAGETERYDMVKYFGDVAFSLEVDEVGIAMYHATRSPYGFHVIKRLE